MHSFKNGSEAVAEPLSCRDQKKPVALRGASRVRGTYYSSINITVNTLPHAWRLLKTNVSVLVISLYRKGVRHTKTKFSPSALPPESDRACRRCWGKAGWAAQSTDPPAADTALPRSLRLANRPRGRGSRGGKASGRPRPSTPLSAADRGFSSLRRRAAPAAPTPRSKS